MTRADCPGCNSLGNPVCLFHNVRQGYRTHALVSELRWYLLHRGRYVELAEEIGIADAALASMEA